MNARRYRKDDVNVKTETPLGKAPIQFSRVRSFFSFKIPIWKNTIDLPAKKALFVFLAKVVLSNIVSYSFFKHRLLKRRSFKCRSFTPRYFEVGGRIIKEYTS
jgi:hypothetical protein